MKRFVEGMDRGQSTLFPECLEDWICEDNPVRVIDVFVGERVESNSTIRRTLSSVKASANRDTRPTGGAFRTGRNGSSWACRAF
jgi:hypothetical protein